MPDNTNNRKETRRMPDNIKSLIDNAPPWLMSVALAMLIAVVRVVYDKEETKPIRVILEAMLCGLLTLVANYAITALGLDQDWSIVSGGAIGFLGSMTVRGLALKLLENRAK